MSSWTITMEQQKYHHDDLVRDAAQRKLVREARRAAKAAGQPAEGRRAFLHLRAINASA